MFGSLLSRLQAPQPDPLNDGDARLALTALLVRVARSDGDYAQEERDLVLKLAQTRFGLSPFEASELCKNAEALEAEAPDTVRFTRAIKDAVAYEDRTGVLEALWTVVMADGIRDHEENALLRLVANLLGVTDQDSAKARRRASQQTT